MAAAISEVPSGFLLKLVHVPPQLVLPPLALADVEKANGQEGEVGHDQEQGQQEAKVQNYQVQSLQGQYALLSQTEMARRSIELYFL